MPTEDPRYAAMSPRERATFDALSGGPGYNPNLGGWRRIDADHYARMREHYTGERTVPLGQDPRPKAKPERVEILTSKWPSVRWYIYSCTPLMLNAGPQPYGEICQTSSC